MPLATGLQETSLAPRAFLLALFLLPTSDHAAITFGQIDDFQNGSVFGWDEGSSSPNPPVNVATGGPAGAGDMYLRNVASGSFGAGAGQIMFNTAQWSGDFNAAGVTQIWGDFANFGANPLYVRLAIRNTNFTYFGSTTARTLPPDGVWRHFAFDLTGGGLTSISGSDTLTDVLAAVGEVRILSAQGGPTHIGDRGNSILGVDNLRAARLAGDVNGDGVVNFTDFLKLETGFGKTFVDPLDAWNHGDFNFNGTVSRDDFMTLYRAFGQSQLFAPAGAPAVFAAIPEPAALPILLLAPLLHRRRRRNLQGGDAADAGPCTSGIFPLHPPTPPGRNSPPVAPPIPEAARACPSSPGSSADPSPRTSTRTRRSARSPACPRWGWTA